MILHPCHWSMIIGALRDTALRDIERAARADLDNNPRLADHKRDQAATSNALANQIEQAH